MCMYSSLGDRRDRARCLRVLYLRNPGSYVCPYAGTLPMYSIYRVHTVYIYSKGLCIGYLFGELHRDTCFNWTPHGGLRTY